MSERKIIADRIGSETRLVVLEDGKPVELAVSYADGKSGRIGNLYKARVETLLKGMNAAFVRIGDEKNAFLSTIFRRQRGMRQLRARGAKRR